MVEPASSKRIVRFGVFEVDRAAGELRKQGLKVKLQEKPFQVLTLLLERPGEVVTREELQRRLWPDTFVDFEHSLSTAIKKLRDALDDTADNPRFIETRPGRGYRFIYPVEGRPAPPISPSPPAPAGGTFARRTLPVAGTALAMAALLIGLNVGGLRERLLGGATPGQITSIAVLPLENLSGDPEQDYFVDGMTEALITNLSKIKALKVISRTSAVRYKDTDKSLPEIARELGVDAVIEGTVRRAGNQVRITVQLIDGATDEHLWAESYQRELRDVLALQSDVAQAIAREVKIAVTPEEETRLADARPVNPEAYEAYLKGRYHASKLTPQDLETALQYFELALEKDPNYALAYTGIAFVWVGSSQMGFVPHREATPKAKAAALKALELDSTLAEAHLWLAIVRVWHEWDWAGGEAEFRRAIELNPNYPGTRAFYSHFLMIMRRPEEAMAQIERAMELDPYNSLFLAFYGQDLIFVRRYDDAIVQFRNALRTTPNSPVALSGLSSAFHQKGMDAEALEVVKKRMAARGDHEAEEALDRGYAQGGYQGAWRRVAETLAARSHTTRVRPYVVAMTYAVAGDNDRALEWLEKAYEERDPAMPYVGADRPELDSLRSDPRFQDLLRRMNFPED